MTTHINKLYELCKEQPFDIEKIKCYIQNNNMNSEAVTRAALQLCDHGMFSYSDYLYHKEKEPKPEELSTYNWELLFNTLIDSGLDANLVTCDDGLNYENILQSLQYFDDGELGARVLRNILSKGGTPNILIGNTLFFAEVDAEFMLDIGMEAYPHKWQVDNAFRFWLVLIGFGGVTKDGKLPVKMREGYSPDVFKDFEKFDYRVIRTKKDFVFKIIHKETDAVIATA